MVLRGKISKGVVRNREKKKINATTQGLNTRVEYR
jgi:hypothetical protein